MKAFIYGIILSLYKITRSKYLLAILMLIDGVRCARFMGVTVGEGCRIYNCNFGTEPYLIRVGNHVSIGSGVAFITHDGGVWVLRIEEAFKNVDRIAPIIVGNNVYIGNRSIILPGVRIGDNVVIGAGSVVSKDIPSHSVAAGCPARVIRSLESYRAKLGGIGLHISHLPPDKKREYLMTHFRDAL